MFDGLSLLLCSRTGTGVPHVSQAQPEMSLLDNQCGHHMTQRTCSDLCHMKPEISCGQKLSENLQVMTTLALVFQCFSLVDLQ